MQITFYSFMMALLYVAAAITVIYFLRKNIRFASAFNIRTIIFIYFLCILRSCIPLEFTFTKVVNTPFIYNWLFPALTREFLGFSFSILNMILFLCVSISIFLLIRLFYEYYQLHKILSCLLAIQDSQFVQKIKEKFPEFKNMEHIIIDPMFQTPMQIGFMKPVILLPDQNYSNTDLYYILQHEMAHFKNHDTWIKLLINIWKCLFWWFPFTYLLYHGLDESLEIKCDLTIISKITTAQKKEYMTALLHVYESQSVLPKTKTLFKNKVSMFYQTEEALISRFQKMQKPTLKNNSVFVFLICCLLFISSYFVVFQAYGQPKYDDSSWTYFSAENTYIILDDENNYHLYVNDQFETIIDENSALQLIKNGILLKKK